MRCVCASPHSLAEPRRARRGGFFTVHAKKNHETHITFCIHPHCHTAQYTPLKRLRTSMCYILKTSSSRTSGSTAGKLLASSLQSPRNKNLAATAQTARLYVAVGVWLFGLGRSVWRSVWCSVVGAASMPRRCVPVSRWGRNLTRRWRTYQQREQQQQQRTAGSKVSPRKTLPPESVTGAAQHKTPGAPPRVPAGARAPAARPLVVKVDDADAAESPRHAQNVPRLHLQHARRRVPLFMLPRVGGATGWAGGHL